MTSKGLIAQTVNLLKDKNRLGGETMEEGEEKE